MGALKVKNRAAALIAVVLTVWIVLWLNFTARDLYKRGDLADYKALIALSPGEKHAYVYGRDFYEFLKFAKKTMPEDASYELTGIERGSLEWRRAVYYLYPSVQTENPDYVLDVRAGKVLR